MNRGYFITTKELMNSSDWPKIQAELDKNFNEVERKERGFGMVEFHGYSGHFSITPIEGESQQYDCIFITDNDRKPKFKEFKPVS